MVSATLDKAIKAVVSTRLDPRTATANKPRSKDFNVDLIKSVPLSRFAVGFMMHQTRKSLDGISYKKFAELIIEDFIREAILDGLEPEDAKAAVKSAVSPATIMRIEDCTGNEGSSSKTLNLIARRLANPITHKAFTPLELQGVSQGLIKIDLDTIDYLNSGEYLDLVKKVNKETDRTLCYI